MLLQPIGATKQGLLVYRPPCPPHREFKKKTHFVDTITSHVLCDNCCRLNQSLELADDLYSSNTKKYVGLVAQSV